MIHLRRISRAEAEALKAVAQKAYLDHYPYLWKDGGQWYVNKVYTADRLSQELQEANAPYFFIEKQGKPIGFLKIRPHFPIVKGGSGLPVGSGAGARIACDKALYLDRVYLQAEGVGQGIGKLVLDFVEAQAQAAGCDTIWLMAMNSSEACRFYEKNGFEACGTWELPFEQLWPQHVGMTIYVKTVRPIFKPNSTLAVQTETPPQ